MSSWVKYSVPLLVAVVIVRFGMSVASAEPRSPRKFDEFGNLACSDELIRLDNYGKEVQAEPNALAVVT